MTPDTPADLACPRCPDGTREPESDICPRCLEDFEEDAEQRAVRLSYPGADEGLWDRRKYR